jgi:hypothetical protein
MADFEKHLAALYESVKPDLTVLPTQQEILSSTQYQLSDLDYEQIFILSSLVVDEMLTIWKKYGSKRNILTDDKLAHFQIYISQLKVELQIFFIQQLKDAGIPIEHNFE